MPPTSIARGASTDSREYVIVCANGVGTPRLLQSRVSQIIGLVGKRLMMHPYAAVAGYYDEQLESWLGPTGQTI